MFYLIGLGLGDAKDITVKGLEIIKKCDKVYLEGYTSILTVGKEELEKFYGKELVIADRELCETGTTELLNDASEKDIALLVVGDPLGATTHTDILLRAKELNIPSQIVHNASIMNAVSCCGLQLYSFGETVSIPYWTEAWKPDSFFDKIIANFDRNLHTLCLLDIKVKEPTEESLIKKVHQYMDPKFMTVQEASLQLLQILQKRIKCVLAIEDFLWPPFGFIVKDLTKTSAASPKSTGLFHLPGSIIKHLDAITEETLAIGLSRVGAPDQQMALRSLQDMSSITEETLAIGLSRVGAPDQQMALRSLQDMSCTKLGAPLHSLVIPAPNLHPLETIYIEQFK